MCGVCTERFAYEIAEKQSEGAIVEFESTIPFQYFQEIGDIGAGLDVAVQYAEKEFQEEESANPNELGYYIFSPGEKGKIVHTRPKLTISDFVPRHIVFCRLLDVLVDHGFESKTFQRLIANPYISDIIDHECNSCFGQEVESIGTPFSDFMSLYDQDTFRDKKKWNAFIEKDSLEKCGNVLSFYIDWWLFGRGLKKEPVEQNGIVDVLNQINQTEFYKFDLIFRVFYFSLLITAQSSSKMQLHLTMVLTNPFYPPYFDALDLWLQRKAALSLYQIHGVQNFLPYDSRIRPLLIFYLAVKGGMPAHERRKLAKSMSLVKKKDILHTDHEEVIELLLNQ
ncbi:MAG: hypothetical protein ACP5SH_09335 [Syntrophobacteraceae bacterium]